jgi:hypothetical protein
LLDAEGVERRHNEDGQNGQNNRKWKNGLHIILRREMGIHNQGPIQELRKDDALYYRWKAVSSLIDGVRRVRPLTEPRLVIAPGLFEAPY